MLWLFGRRDTAEVRLEGSAEAVERARRARVGV